VSRLLILALAAVAATSFAGPGHAQQKQQPTGNPPYVTVPPPQSGVKQPQGVCPCYQRNGVYAGYATAACCYRR
jgi:hypothetical protein